MFTATQTALGSYVNPLAPRVELRIGVEVGFSFTEFGWLSADTFEGQTNGMDWRSAPFTHPDYNASHVVNTGRGLTFRVRKSAAAVAYTLTVDLNLHPH